MPLYFAYGSNMSRGRLEARIGPVTDHGRALLPDHRHRFSKLGLDGTGKGNIEVATGLVWGVLFQLAPGQVEPLKTYERGYRTKFVRLDLGGLGLGLGVGDRAGGVLTFEAIERVQGLRPTDEYLEHYRQGMVEHGFPERYILEVLDR